MSDPRFTILSTASLPFDRAAPIPDAIDVQVVPFIEIVPSTDPLLEAQIDALSAKQITAVFTSAHAVKYVAGWLTKKPDWNIYCIRNETRVAVINWFGNSPKIKFANNALFLSKYMISDGVPEAVFFCGDQRLDVLPDNLIKNGVRLTEYVVYETRQAPVALQKTPDAILFFSPSAVRSFFSLNKLSSETLAFVMGKTTGEELKKYSAKAPVISPEADKAFVLNMALEYGASH